MKYASTSTNLISYQKSNQKHELVVRSVDQKFHEVIYFTKEM